MRKKTAYRPSEPHKRYVTRKDGSRVINDAYIGPSRQPGGRTSSNFADIIGAHDVDREIERLYGDDAIPYEVNVPASGGRFINADVNGAFNIMRKVVPEELVYFNGVEDYAVNPLRVDVNSHKYRLS